MKDRWLVLGSLVVLLTSLRCEGGLKYQPMDGGTSKGGSAGTTVTPRDGGAGMPPNIGGGASDGFGGAGAASGPNEGGGAGGVAGGRGALAGSSGVGGASPETASGASTGRATGAGGDPASGSGTSMGGTTPAAAGPAGVGGFAATGGAASMGGMGATGGGTGALCSEGLTSCSEECVDLAVSNVHCGQCGNPCSAAETCSHGKCLLRDGEPCGAGQSCYSGICNMFFRDEDGDGHGTPANSTGRCTISSPPAGYVAISDDCCDNGGNRAIAAKIHPGADFQSESAGGVCGITWDYNCNNVVDLGPDFSVFSYCPYACSVPLCQTSTCAASPRTADPQASDSCGRSVSSCSYGYAGFPTATCMQFNNGPSPGDPAYRLFTCR